jgi:hypothetical protein
MNTTCTIKSKLYNIKNKQCTKENQVKRKNRVIYEEKMEIYEKNAGQSV